jgi:polyhydroxybutyrate depolymerase
MFHYATGNAARMETTSGMSRVGDRNGFLVVYPNGRGTTWVSGAADDLDASQYDRSFRGPRGNDVHFTARLIDTISARLCVDAHRIYAGGLSSGGSMAYRLACDLSDRIAAIAPVGGTYTYTACHPSHPVSVIAFHGTDNPAIPFGGGGEYHTPALPAWERMWARRDHCWRGPSLFLRLRSVRATRYFACRQRSEVQLYRLIGEGDQWPDPHDLAGAPGSRSGHAAEIMWRFFALHER